MEFIFEDPTILDELDYLYKSDVARKLLFYYQPDPPVSEDEIKNVSGDGDTEEKREGVVSEVRYKDRPRKILHLRLRSNISYCSRQEVVHY